MPPKKSSSSPQKTSRSPKRLSSRTEENQNQELNPEEQETPETEQETIEKSDVDQANSSSNSEEDKESSKDDDSKDEKSDGKKSKKHVSKYTPVGSIPDGQIIPYGEELKFNATRHSNFAIVDQDVYREVLLRGSNNRVSYELVYSAGTAIPLSVLDQIK